MKYDLYPVIIDKLNEVYGFSDENTSATYRYIYMRTSIYYNRRKVSGKELFDFILEELNLSVLKEENGIQSYLEYEDEKYHIYELSSEILDNLVFRADMEGSLDIKDDLEVVFKKGYSKANKFRGVKNYESHLMLARLTLLNDMFNAKPSYTSGIEGFTNDVNHNPFKRSLEERLEVELKLSEHSESNTTTFISEEDLEDYLVKNLDLIEKGLTFIKRQVDVMGGFIDIIATDSNGSICIIEIKTSEDKSIIWQAIHYPKEIKNKYKSKHIRMITVAPKYSKPIYDALKSLDDVETFSYEITVSSGSISNLKVNMV